MRWVYNVTRRELLSLFFCSAGIVHARGKSDLCEMAVSGRLPGLRWPDFSGSCASVIDFYQSLGCALAWNDQQAAQWIEMFRQAGLKGLNPSDYDGDLWDARLADVPGDSAAATCDLALTVCAMRYLSDLHFGRFNPAIYDRACAPGVESIDLTALMRDLTHMADMRSAVEAVEPPFPGYRRAESALARYLALIREDDSQPLPAPVTPLRPGERYPPAALLADRLSKVGDLSPETARHIIGVYDATLSQAVKRFQLRHGLEADGRLGRSTIAQLNTPFSVRVRQLQFTLERWRWVPHSLPRPPIVVNIPEFELRGLNSDYATELSMKVVVGKAYGHQTPVFASDLKYVVFRPYWDVPTSIQRAEITPKLTGDRSYLDRNEFELVAGDGKVLPGGRVNDATLARVRAGQLRVRQKPGAKNALGLVKFLFPNEHNVYLHGSPETSLFAKARRDFSHGCIRVERPEDLAYWLLRDVDGWTQERIHAAMNGTKTITITLPRTVPVLIVYATAVALEGGEVRFLADIYGQDAQLEALAAKGYLMRRPQHRLPIPSTERLPRQPRTGESLTCYDSS